MVGQTGNAAGLWVSVLANRRPRRVQSKQRAGNPTLLCYFGIVPAHAFSATGAYRGIAIPMQEGEIFQNLALPHRVHPSTSSLLTLKNAVIRFVKDEVRFLILAFSCDRVHAIALIASSSTCHLAT